MTGARARRSGVQATVGMIVEGDAEFATFPRMHKEVAASLWPPIKAINLGGVGSDLEPQGIAARIVPKIIQLHVGKVERVVVCFDREQRDQCVVAFANAVTAAIHAKLREKGRPDLHFAVVIADRCFEAWLLAGAASLTANGSFKSLPSTVCFEGSMGERKRKGVLELNKALGRDYRMTTDGPKLFLEMDHVASADHGPGKRGSRSLRKLHKELGGRVPCDPPVNWRAREIDTLAVTRQ